MNIGVQVFSILLILNVTAGPSVAWSASLPGECADTVSLSDLQENKVAATLSGHQGAAYKEESTIILSHLDSFYERHGDPVANAKIIFLGEPHTMPSLSLGNQVVINKLSRPGDIVLVEGFNAGERFPKSMQKTDTRTELLKGGLTVVGWDALGALDETLTNDQEYRKNPPLDVVEAQLDAAKKKNPNSPETRALQTLATKQHALLIQHVKVALIQRNRALIETLKRALAKNPKAKIFILAGYLHYTSGVSDELRNYLASLPTTALIPNFTEWDKFQTAPEEKAATTKYRQSLDSYIPHQLAHIAHPCGNILFNEQIPFPSGTDLEPASR